jgi:hypothetical protein
MPKPPKSMSGEGITRETTVNITTQYIGKSQVDKVYILKNSKLRRKEV